MEGYKQALEYAQGDQQQQVQQAWQQAGGIGADLLAGTNPSLSGASDDLNNLRQAYSDSHPYTPPETKGTDETAFQQVQDFFGRLFSNVHQASQGVTIDANNPEQAAAQNTQTLDALKNLVVQTGQIEAITTALAAAPLVMGSAAPNCLRPSSPSATSSPTPR
jgi:hypothetical protein